VTGIYAEIEAEIPRLRRYARALTRDVTAADDLVQDCLTRALDKLHLWQKGTDLRAWLFTILHNQYVNYVRRSVREGVAVGLSDNEPLLTRAPHQGHRLELRDLERALAKLPEEQRSAILLVGLEGMRYEEVAAVLHVPVGTIRSRLSRGRETLRKLVGIDPDERETAATQTHRALADKPEAGLHGKAIPDNPRDRAQSGKANTGAPPGDAGCGRGRGPARQESGKRPSERQQPGTNHAMLRW
jgi:RNA polymerase sigma-70 factor (ECF subfamily)